MSAAYLHRVWGPVEAGGALMFSWSKTENEGDLFVVPMPLLSVRHRAAALNLTYFPSIGVIDGLSALALFATFYPFGAPESAGSPAVSEPAARNGARAVARTGLEFQVEDLLELESYRGTTIAFKKRFDNRLGLRLGLRLDLGARDTEYRRTIRDTLRNTRDAQEDDYHITLVAQYLFFTYGQKDMAFCFGAGPLLGYAHSYSENIDTDLRYGGRSVSFREEDTWRYGLAFAAGVEWGFLDDLALTAEYGLDVVYGKRRLREYHSYGNWERSESTTFGIEGQTVRAGLTFYFL